MSHYNMERGWQKNAVFGRDAFSRRDAWIWLIENASWRDREYWVVNKRVELKRGQLSYSLRYLAEQWRWSEPKVRRYLARIKKAEMIRLNADVGQIVITICNYEQYQTPLPETDAENDEGSTQKRRNGDANHKKDKKDKKEESIIPGIARSIDDEFVEFWAAYPEKVAKPTAKAAFAKARKAATLDVILAGLGRYVAGKPADRAWSHPTTWLNGHRWADGDSGASGPATPSAADEVIRWRERLKASVAHRGYWDAKGWGPRPGEPGCVVPAQLLAEFPAAGKALQ